MKNDKLAVTQEARDAAADLAEKLGDLIFLGGNDLAAIRAGIWDNDDSSGDVLSLFVPAFARFEAQARLAGERIGMERAAAYISGQATMLRNTYDLAAVQTSLPVAEPAFSAYAVEAMATFLRKEAASIQGGSNG